MLQKYTAKPNKSYPGNVPDNDNSDEVTANIYWIIYEELF